MADPREAFARSIADAIGEHLNVSDYADLSSLGSAQIDGYVDLLGVATEILATYLVVPRSDIVTEYGVEFRGMNFGGHRSADVARFRARTMYGLGEDAARERETWAGPWSPIPLPEDGQ